jgi:hypothetical protein
MNFLRLAARTALLSALLLGGGCSRKSTPEASRDAFFTLLREGKFNEAYNNAAFAFQARQTAANFEGVARDLRLASFPSIKWEAPTERDGEVIFEGAAVSPEGQQLPLRAAFIKERGAWRLYSLKSRSGAGGDTFSLSGKNPAFNASMAPMPDGAELNQLVRETLIAFNQAVQTGDFGSFHESIAKAWQGQVSERRLREAFQSFIDRKVDISSVKDLDPKLEGTPRIDGSGVLHVRGEFPTQPRRTLFAMRFVYEAPRWKLFGIDVSIAKPPAEPVPPVPETGKKAAEPGS